MARVITKELAEQIVRKLGATIDMRKGRPHDLAKVWEGGLLVAMFGIRRGSSKDQGHDHIPDLLHIRPNEAKNLGLCPMSREEWIERLREKGLLQA